MNNFNDKKAQSEMMGFIVIVIIISVLILMFIYFSVSSPKESFVNSEKVESFIQSVLEYSTSCDSRYEMNIPMRKVIAMCAKNEECDNNKNSCDVMKEDLVGMVNASWTVGAAYPLKGYALNVTYRGDEIFSKIEGNVTFDSRGSEQPFADGTDVVFILYS